MKTNYCTALLATSATLLTCLFLQTAHAGVYDDLMIAANRDETEAVLALLGRGMDPNSVDTAGNTLLHIAARNGNLTLIDGLIKSKVKLQPRNRVGDTPLMLAAYGGRVEVVEKLVNAGAEINQDGWAALHYAAYSGSEAVARYLVGKGAKVDARAPNDQTALMIAARTGSVPMVRMLLDWQARPDLIDQHGNTALSLAKQANNTEIAQIIEVALSKLPPPEPKVEAAPTTPAEGAATEVKVEVQIAGTADVAKETTSEPKTIEKPIAATTEVKSPAKAE